MDVKKKSKKQEEKVAKELNGRPTPASGALWGAKGDVRTQQFLVECKYTDRTYYSLTKNVWRKIAKEALADNFRTPLMCIEILGESFAVIRRNDFDLYNQLLTTIEDFNYIIDVTHSSFRLNHGAIGIGLCSCVGWGANGGTVELLVIPWNEFKQMLKL